MKKLVLFLFAVGFLMFPGFVSSQGSDTQIACEAASACTVSCETDSKGDWFCPKPNPVSGTDRATKPPAGLGTAPAANLFGKLTPPPGVAGFAAGPAGLVSFVSVILKLLVVVAGIYAVVQIIFAGYMFMSAGGDPKAFAAAWGRVWQSLVGLVVVASSFLIAAVVGQILFGDAGAILNPKLYLP